MSRRTEKFFSLLGALLLAGSLSALSGCSTPRPHEFPADGSPSLDAVSSAFTSLELAGTELRPHSAGDSEQLLQQGMSAAQKMRESGVKIEPETCREPVLNAANPGLLYWDSIYASDEQGRRAAQVFLAPSEDDAVQAVQTMADSAAACPSATVNFEGKKTVTSTMVLPILAGSGPVGAGEQAAYQQQITSEAESTVVTTYFVAYRNAVMSVTIQDLTAQPEKTLAGLQDFASRYLQVLGAHFE